MFKFSVSKDTIKEAAMFVARMCNKMSEDDVPHNVAFIRGKPLRYSSTSLTSSDEYIVRLYIWPRRPTLGARVRKDIIGRKIKKFRTFF